MEEEVSSQMGFTKEEVKKSREKYAKKKTKYVPPLVEQLAKPSPSRKGMLKKKKKPKRTYIAISLVSSETES